MMHTPTPPQSFRNAIEELVLAEAELQIQNLPTALREQICLADVAAYALNRLPPLYATSEKGWRFQQLKANRDADQKVVIAVRQALAAVRRDPLRNDAEPLPTTYGGIKQELALRELQEILQRDDLNWQNLAAAFEQRLVETTKGQMAWRKRSAQTWDNHQYLR